MKILPAIKRGDFFGFIVSLTDELGNVLSGAVALLKSEVRNESDVLVATLDISEEDTPGEYLFKAESTANWPTGCYLYTDIQYSSENVVSSSETIRILVLKDVTR